METTTVKEINAQRVAEANLEKAKKFIAVRSAEIAKAYDEFVLRHVAARGSYDAQGRRSTENLYYPCQANEIMLVNYLKEHGLNGTSAEHFEAAFQATKGRTLTKPTNDADYEKKTPTPGDSLFCAQVSPEVSRATSKPVRRIVPFTKAELLDMTENNMDKFKRLIKRYGIESINAILAEL